MAHPGDDAAREEVDFFVVGFGHAAARRFACRAEHLGFTVELSSDSGLGDWTCVCTKAIPSSSEDIARTRVELDQLSAPLGGRNEGWGIGR
jgi:hypothetical protein